MKERREKFLLLAAILILVLGSSAALRGLPPAQSSGMSEATRTKILNYIRERFGVGNNVKLTMGPLQTSPIAPGFDGSSVMVDDGKSPHAQPILVSKDGRYLIVILGSVIDLPQDTPTVMAQRVQETFKTPANLKLSVTGIKHSATPDFEQGTLVMDDGRSPKQDRNLLITRDGKHLIVSDMYNLSVDPRQQALHGISLHDEPTQGPSNAPVTIVEYADLQCPTCARMQEFLETKVLPKYGDKVRIVFKEFPLVGLHDWSFTAAIADQCAYELNPASYAPFRTAIFRNQQLINITNLRDTLLSLGEQAGLNRVSLAGCLDAKSSLPRVQRDMNEGKAIEVNQTPTVFINGRMLMGLPSEEAYYQAIDEALHGK